MTKRPNRNKAKRELASRMIYHGKPLEYSGEWRTRFIVGFSLVALIYMIASYAGI